MTFKIKIYPSIGDTFIIVLNDDSFEHSYGELLEEEINAWIDDHLINVEDWRFYPYND